MASLQKSMLSTAGVFANAIFLASGLVAAAPSWAARDAGQMIAQDKANRDVIARRQAALAAPAETQVAEPASEVLPLDHGPRATTTPWANAQRRLRMREAARAAAASATLSSAGADSR